MEEADAILVISATLFVLVAHCGIEAQLATDVQLALQQKSLLQVPRFLVLAVHQQQHFCSPVTLQQIKGFRCDYSHEIGVVKREVRVSDAETAFLHADLPVDELVGHMLDLAERNVLEHLFIDKLHFLDTVCLHRLYS